MSASASVEASIEAKLRAQVTFWDVLPSAQQKLLIQAAVAASASASPSPAPPVASSAAGIVKQPAAPRTATALRSLNNLSTEWTNIQQLFDRGWKHPNKARPRSLYAIYSVELPDAVLASYTQYRESIKATRGQATALNEEKLLFHGTRRACVVGDSPNSTELCNFTNCAVCCILRASFAVERAGTAPGRNFLRYGRGVYATSVSSKAHDYTGAQTNSKHRAMLVARVALGYAYNTKWNHQTWAAAPEGYDSVQGLVGPKLNYEESVVYSNDAIRPAYLILYESA